MNREKTIKTKAHFKTIFLIIIGLIALGCQSAFAQSQAPGLKIGDAAPEIKLGKLMQASPGSAIDWKSLKGQTVVIEFWATWCSPCMPAINHLNQLADQFKGQPVQFISITDETDEALISKFLNQRPIKGWVGLDADRKTFKSFDVGTRPTTIVVDSQGKIAGITDYENVSIAAVTDLIAGKKVSFTTKAGLAEVSANDKAYATKEAEPLFRVVIKPTINPTPDQSTIPEPNRITFDGIPLLSIIATAYKVPKFRLDNRLSESESTALYDSSVVVPKGRGDLLYPTLQIALEATFSIKTRREMREKDVYVLSIPEGHSVNLPLSKSDKPVKSVWRGKINGQKQSIQQLAEFLGLVMSMSVVDETGLKGEFDWDLSYNHADNSLLIDSIKEKLGLELKKAKRQVEVLVVEKDESAKAKTGSDS